MSAKLTSYYLFAEGRLEKGMEGTERKRKTRTNYQMKKHFFLIVLAAIFMAKSAFTQTLPSPSSMGVVKNSTSPVSLFTGTSSVSVPLFAATNSTGARVPVALQYNASGIKVNEVAGPVGLGWNLMAGGTITRVTRGIPDEYGNMVSDPSNVNGSKLNGILNGLVDAEKDLFYFNFPGGSGKFIFEGGLHGYANQVRWCESLSGYSSQSACIADCANDPNEEACSQSCSNFNMTRLACSGFIDWTDFQTLPYSDLQIKYRFNGYTEGFWTITDPQGVEYVFDYKETTTSSSTEPNGSTFGDEYTYVSTWNLGAINYPNGDNITFNYTQPVDQTTITSEYRTIATTPGSGTNRTLAYESQEETQHKTIIGTRYLSSILFAKGSIDFSYDTREDLTGGQRLKTVSLKDKQGNTVSAYSLNQNYFSANKSFLQGSTNGCVSDETCKRLKLSSITKDGAFHRSFSYRNEEGYSGTGINYYELPPRNSFYFDNQGYFNAGGVLGNNHVAYPRLLNASVQEKPNVDYQLITGMDRTPNDYAQANILTQMNYATGGYTQYAYQSHVANSGGVRIQSILNYNDSENLISGSTYFYEMPVAAPNPLYHYYYAEAAGQDKIALRYRSATDVLALSGPPIGYGKVTVTDAMGQGKVEHYFKTDLRANDIAPYKHAYNVESDNSLVDLGVVVNPISVHPFSTYSLLYYDRGSYDSTKTYDAGNNLIAQRVYTYDDHEETADYTITNLSLEVKEDFGSSKDVYLSRYDMVVRPFRLKSVLDTFYDTGGSVSSTTSYTYDNTNKTISTEVKSVKSDGYESKSITTYLGSFGGKNLFGVPSQVESQIKLPGYSNFMTSGLRKTDFKTEHGLVVPHKTYTLAIDVPIAVNSWTTGQLVETNEWVDYNSRGQVLQQKGLDGVITSFEYDADGYLLKTKVNPGTVYERVTTYTHEPLVGIASIKDANDRSVFYEYDNRNRLLLTKSNEENITSRYRYNSIMDNDALSADIDVSFHPSGNLEDHPHNFSLSNINCPYGECNFVWNWGDGTATNTGNSASHTYIEPGTYEVTVDIFNPEYEDPVSETLNVTITNYNLSANLNVSYSNECHYEDDAHSFSLSSIYCPTGGCTYAWNWGDGTTSGNVTSTNHVYTNPGSYIVSVDIINSQFNEATTVSTTVDICEETLWTLTSINGPTTDCIEEPPSGNDVRFWVNFSTSSSCNFINYSYSWQYRTLPSGNWSNMANQNGSEAYFLSNWLIAENNYEIRVTTTDNCGRTQFQTKNFNVQDCSSPPPPPPPSCTISVSPGTKTFTDGGGSSNFSVSLTGSATYSVSDNRSWITTSKSGNTVTVSVGSTVSTRSGTVTVTGAGGCTDTIAITQNGPSNSCPFGCTWDPVDERCEDTNGNPNTCGQ